MLSSGKHMDNAWIWRCLNGGDRSIGREYGSWKDWTVIQLYKPGMTYDLLPFSETAPDIDSAERREIEALLI